MTNLFGSLNVPAQCEPLSCSIYFTKHENNFLLSFNTGSWNPSSVGQHWFRQWHVSCSATSHHIKQCWLFPIWWPKGQSHISEIGSKMLWYHDDVENGNLFHVIGLFAGNSPATGEFSAQRPVTPSFDVFYDLRLNKRLSKQSWSWWLERPSRPLWSHCYDP